MVLYGRLIHYLKIPDIEIPDIEIPDIGMPDQHVLDLLIYLLFFTHI